jgi:phosphatidate cytidylyltransferase
MNVSKLSNFQQRFFMSFLGIVILTAVIFLSQIPPLHYLFVIALALLQARALSEYYTLSIAKGFSPLVKMPIIASILYIFLHAAIGPHCTLPFLFVFLALSFIMLFAKHQQAIANVAITAFGLIYITLPLSYLVDIISIGTPVWLIYLLVTTKMTDTFGYVGGKLTGRHLLAPKLSPKKTIEGAIAGLLGSILASIAFTLVLNITLNEALLLGTLIGVISQIGDLAESLLKRDAKVKDSSTLPGFGGMLDVFDSLIFTTPVLYFWLKTQGVL